MKEQERRREYARARKRVRGETSRSQFEILTFANRTYLNDTCQHFLHAHFFFFANPRVKFTNSEDCTVSSLGGPVGPSLALALALALAALLVAVVAGPTAAQKPTTCTGKQWGRVAIIVLACGGGGGGGDGG